MLRYLAVCDAEPVNLLNSETLTRRQDAPELALVRGAARAPYRHLVPVRDGVLNVGTAVGEDGEEPVQTVLDPRALVLGACGVVKVVGRDKLVGGVDVVPIPNLFDVSAHYGLVLLGRHEPSPSRRSPAIVNHQ
jgi:hypothetical protein